MAIYVAKAQSLLVFPALCAVALRSGERRGTIKRVGKGRRTQEVHMKWLGRKQVIIPVVLLMLTGPVGCTQGGRAPKVVDVYEQHKALVQLAVQLGVSKFLAEHPQHAALVYDIAHQARLVLHDGMIDVTQVVPLVLEKIAQQSKLDADVRMLLEMLTAVVAQEVQGIITRAKIPPQQSILLVSEVLTWIEQSARVPRRT